MASIIALINHALSGTRPQRVPSGPAMPHKRSYGAGMIDRLTSDWNITLTSQDTETRNDLVKVRARCRDLERNNDHYRRWLNLLKTNVIGSNGVQLQMQIKNPDGQTLDMAKNNLVQAAWDSWCKKENCTVTRKHTWLEVKKLILRSCARDGGIMIRIVEGFDNDFGFALQLLETDHLDTYYNAMLPNGNEVRMGVELDKWKQAVAYYLWTRHPGDYYSQSGFKRERILASEIIFPFVKDRAESTVGFPWGSAALRKLNMLDAYEEAELVAARTGACAGGFFTKKSTSQSFDGDKEDENGTQIVEMEPGSFRDLPLGVEFTPYKPEHPMQAFGEFIRAALRGIASGLGVSYTSLANDIEHVNFSSIRAGLLDEREEYKDIQQWLIDDAIQPVFERWLPFAILSGQVKLPMSKIATYIPKWIGRRWPWVDPLKDAMASTILVEKGFRSRRRIIADMGEEFEETHNEIKQDQEYDEKLGLVFPSDVPPPEPPTMKNIAKEPDENNT